MKKKLMQFALMYLFNNEHRQIFSRRLLFDFRTTLVKWFPEFIPEKILSWAECPSGNAF